MPCTVRLIKPLPLAKTGVTLPEGAVAQMDDFGTATFDAEGAPRVVRFSPYRLGTVVEVVGRGGEGIPVDEAPSEEELQPIIHDSVCPSITGYDVEPDGYDPDGAPSWLLILGLV